VTGRSLLANLRARGLRVQHVGSALHVAPRAALTDADREALRQHRTELIALLQAESDPGVIAAIDVFPGVQVVSTGHPAVWPPRGGVDPVLGTHDRSVRSGGTDGAVPVLRGDHVGPRRLRLVLSPLPSRSAGSASRSQWRTARN
jgi:hypothetical protein